MKRIKYIIFIFIFSILSIASSKDVLAEQEIANADNTVTNPIFATAETTVQFGDQFVRDQVLLAINNNLPNGVEIQTEVTTTNILFLNSFTLYGYFESIDGLEFAKNVKSLKMSRSEDRNTPSLNIDVLSTMTQLELLEITQCKLVDISSVANLTNLFSLNLGLNNIENISPLNTLSKLKVLILNQNNIQDISTINSIVGNIANFNLSDQSVNIEILEPVRNGTLVFENLAKGSTGNILTPVNVSTDFLYEEPNITFKNIPVYAQYLGYQVKSEAHKFNCYISLKIINNPLQSFFLRFDLNGYPGTSPDMQAIYEGEFATQPPDPLREGYIFKEWNTDKYGNGSVWDFTGTTMPANDVILYAQWIKNIDPIVEYTLRFDLNGGQGVKPVEQILKEGEKAEQPIIPIREGYIFKEWNTDKYGRGTVWDFAGTTMPANDVLLYAQWEENKKPVSPLDSGSSTSPKTGDSTGVLAIILLFLGSAITMRGLVNRKKI